MREKVSHLEGQPGPPKTKSAEVTRTSAAAPQLSPRFSLAKLTTLGVGGPARWLAPIEQRQELNWAWEWADRKGLPMLYLGEGSNVLFSDRGFAGLVLQNRILGRDRAGTELRIGGGENLGEVICWANRQQLGGMEKMYGIPGTVAGAVVGNAGAYGQEIGDLVTDVEVWDQGQARSLSAREAGFGYRESVFKTRRDWFILSCTIRLQRSSRDLMAVSTEILSRRLEKYPTGLKCPGSFFKNVVVKDLPPTTAAAIPADFITYGKIPAGRLLEEVGAKGAGRGNAQFAPHHANLLVNRGHATSRDIVILTEEYAQRVLRRFGIRLIPEIRIVDHSEERPRLEK